MRIQIGIDSSKNDMEVPQKKLNINPWLIYKGEGGMFQENSIETCRLSRVKQITGPGWMHETSARTWCSGRTWRERVGREVGGEIGMGKTCEPKAFSFQCMTKFTTKKKKNPWLIHFNVWQNPLQYCKVISLQLIKKKKRTIIIASNSTPGYTSGKI